MKIRIAAVAIAALCLPMLVAGCGGSDDTNSGSRPSASEIAAAFKKEIPAGTPYADKIADCFGKKLVASDLPNGVLRSFAAGDDKTSVDADNKDKYEKIVKDAGSACAKEVVGAATGS